MDIWSKEKRSSVMSKIRSKNTKPEIALRSLLFKSGFRYRLHCKDLPGKPDIVMPRYRTAIFVNGCFWHLHKDCNEGRVPMTNSKFWKQKLLRNVKNDKKSIEQLRKHGWNTFVVWECEIEKNPDQTVKRLIDRITKLQG